MSVDEHKRGAPASARCFVLTISDTRTLESDASGAVIAGLLKGAGHEVVGRSIVRDDPTDVKRIVGHQLATRETQIIITTGGTGIASRDNTYEAISGLLQKRLEGFGELFRMLSYQEIGSAAMLSRACGGCSNGKIIFALPGSESAVRLAMTKLIIPEIGHLLREMSR
jgi:molybdenum cofactor biosynthesis protein B